MEFNIFLNQTLTAVSEIATRNFGKVAATIKTGDNNQVLTQTDLEIGSRIIEAIEKEYPTHNIIDEEAGVLDKGSAYTWVVDPIDGTSNFANGIPTYGLMIGLLREATPIASGIALPAFNEHYLAEKNKGAYCNGRRLAVTSQTDLSAALVAYGIDSHREHPALTHNECRLLADIVLHIRNLRSSNSVFDLAMLARGSYGAVLNRTSRIWDNVAIHLLIEEAGGKYTDFFGNPMEYADPLRREKQNYTFCAASPLLHEQLQKIIHRHLSS
jgi:myo-inositol-1(or 4)-monophosphatase